MLANQQVRDFLRSNAVPFWRISRELGMCEQTFSKKMRDELSEEEKKKIIKLAEKIKNERLTAGTQGT